MFRKKNATKDTQTCRHSASAVKRRQARRLARSKERSWRPIRNTRCYSPSTLFKYAKDSEGERSCSCSWQTWANSTYGHCRCRLWSPYMEARTVMHKRQYCGREPSAPWCVLLDDGRRTGGYLQNHTSTPATEISTSWPDLAHVLRYKFLKYTQVSTFSVKCVAKQNQLQVTRPLSDRDMDYLAEKIYGVIYTDWSQAPSITFQRFAKVRTFENVGKQKTTELCKHKQGTRSDRLEAKLTGSHIQVKNV